MAVGQVQLGAVHGTLVVRDRALVLLDQIDLILDLLARYAVLAIKRLVARVVRTRLGQQPHVVRQRALCLFQRHLIGARVDLGQEVAFLHHLALGEGDLLQLTVDLRFDGDRRQRGHRAETGQDHIEITRRDGRGAD